MCKNEMILILSERCRKNNLAFAVFAEKRGKKAKIHFSVSKNFDVEQCVKTGCNHLKLSTKTLKYVENLQHKNYTIPLFDIKYCKITAKNGENDCFTMLIIHFCKSGKIQVKNGMLKS